MELMKATFLAGCICLGVSCFAASPLTLKKPENSYLSANFEILLNEQAVPAEEFAALELQKYLKMITGIHVPIHNCASPWGWKCRILLCLPDSPHSKGLFSKDFATLKGTDGYAVRRRGNMIYLIADCPKGLLNGVYRFLMKNTDIIWPRPAKGLTIFTPQETLTFHETDYLDLPKFKYRGWGWSYNHTVKVDELEEWRARMCFNRSGSFVWPMNLTRDRRLGFADGYCTIYEYGHNMISHWLPVKEYGGKHPEYYMLIDGKRYVKDDANPCYTNPEVAPVIAKRIIAEIGQQKKTPTIVIVQNSDQGLTCECPECLKPIKLADETYLTKDNEAFRSTQFFIFFNKIAEEVAKKYPDVIIQTYGYFFTVIPPKVKLEPNILVSYCPYPRNDKEPFSGKTNARWKSRTGEWLKITSNLQLREYYYCMARFPRPLAEIMVQDLRYFQTHAIPSVTCEFTWSDDEHLPDDMQIPKKPARMFWDLAAGEVWVMSQLLWDPHQDVSKLRDEFLNRTYREGASEMREFYKLIRDAWLNDSKGSAYNDDIVKSFGYYILGKKIDKQCLVALDNALNAVKHPESKKLIEKAHDTFLFYLGLAKSDSIVELSVPRLKNVDFPGFDLNTGVWKKAAVFPKFCLLFRKNMLSAYPMTLKVFHDGQNLYLGTSVKKAVSTLKGKPSHAKDTVFPSGDHAEFFFVNNKDHAYYHLAWNVAGALYDARGGDYTWNGNWEVRVEKGVDGWRSVAKIPFSEMGFTVQVYNKLSAMLMITSFDEKDRREHAVWGGGRVHSPESFGELVLDLE